MKHLSLVVTVPHAEVAQHAHSCMHFYANSRQISYRSSREPAEYVKYIAMILVVGFSQHTSRTLSLATFLLYQIYHTTSPKATYNGTKELWTDPLDLVQSASIHPEHLCIRLCHLQ